MNDWEYDEPITMTEWAVILDRTGEIALDLSEELARMMVADREDVTLVSREVTRQPWRVHGRGGRDG